MVRHCNYSPFELGCPRIGASNLGAFHYDAVAAHATSDTLRISLAVRALGDELFPDVAVSDACARDTLARLGDDGRLWLKHLPTVYGILARTCVFRALAQGSLRAYTSGHIVNLGCGFSHYFQWLDNGQTPMTDADLPVVVALHRKLLGRSAERHSLIDLDLCLHG